MPDKANSLTIGGLAKAANVHVETIRYYQRRRLVRSRNVLQVVLGAMVQLISSG